MNLTPSKAFITSGQYCVLPLSVVPRPGDPTLPLSPTPRSSASTAGPWILQPPLMPRASMSRLGRQICVALLCWIQKTLLLLLLRAKETRLAALGTQAATSTTTHPNCILTGVPKSNQIERLSCNFMYVNYESLIDHCPRVRDTFGNLGEYSLCGERGLLPAMSM
ncbi:hypothetical protein E2C01_029034 [Portunus trituberculatus]|uniref:Uncharacterized protein n=1 Tax=Portunus trituberculatus TaxID=210409 RepID=A0A5B7EQQ7_PORTR|nr:hypothetical protein [Portunus trituberculatus]